MIALDLCQPHYQVLLITYLKFAKKNAKDARKEEKSVFIFIELKNNKLRILRTQKRWFKPVIGLIKTFPNIHQFCNGDINKFVLLLRKGVYSYEYMDNWERFDETSLPDKKIFLQRILSRRHYW